MIAPTAIIRGTGMTFGIDIFDVEGTTGYYNSNLNNKAEKAVELMQGGEYDFGFVHVKAVDDAGHDKSLKIKIEQLEKVDHAIRILVEKLGNPETQKAGQEYVICITGDHTTPVIL
jgi:2,3-bisphosphoglycerate-independent phosphoglycerate mutase